MSTLRTITNNNSGHELNYRYNLTICFRPSYCSVSLELVVLLSVVLVKVTLSMIKIHDKTD